MSHPLAGLKIQGVGFKCFPSAGSGFITFAPISLVIGKNNSGKSAILDMLSACAGQGTAKFRSSQFRIGETAAVELWQALDHEKLERQFRSNTSGGEIGGNHRAFAEHYLFNTNAKIRLSSQGVSVEEIEPHRKSLDPLKNAKIQIEACVSNPLTKTTIIRVAAERSVVPEVRAQPDPRPNGAGITNMIRYFINNDSRPRDAVEVDLLKDLNRIYAGDNIFSSILCQENDEGIWEIFLREEGKGDIRLSESGSSLQSIFIILSYLRLVPILKLIEYKDLIIAIEEPENNLHPALLRRLVDFLAEERDKLKYSLIFTTHSPICIDWSSRREESSIIHVIRDGASSKCQNVLDYDGHTTILDDLDVRGSDLLQSNGIIWVEGPSDRIYIRRWIDLSSSHELVEGSHYTFMYYGGRILAHFEAARSAELSSLISMVTVNRNLAIVIDSDRKPAPSSSRLPPRRLNDTKNRLIEEVEARRGFSWVTRGKEIENYIPEQVWKRVISPDINIRDEFVDIPNMPAVKQFKATKVPLAHEIAESLDKNDLETLDLPSKLKTLIQHIKKWNALS